jgi:hypothetical protein
MNLNGDEKRIQQLFHEMRLDEQRRTPGFAGVLAAANAGIASSQNRGRSLRFALATAVLCFAVLIALAIIERPWKPRGPAAEDEGATAQLEQPHAPGAVESKLSPEAPVEVPRKTTVRHAHRRPASNPVALATKSLFAWQSPTASLLQTPDDELLKSLPRLGESLKTIRFFSPDEFN